MLNENQYQVFYVQFKVITTDLEETNLGLVLAYRTYTNIPITAKENGSKRGFVAQTILPTPINFILQLFFMIMNTLVFYDVLQ